MLPDTKKSRSLHQGGTLETLPDVFQLILRDLKAVQLAKVTATLKEVGYKKDLSPFKA